MRQVRILAAAFVLAAGAAPAAETPSRAPAPSRLCPDDLPDGVRLPPRPGCDAVAARPPKGRDDGFRDLGEGVSVRIGGRAGAEYGVRR